MCSVRGVPGGSKMHTSNLLSSGALKDIMSFVKFSKEVPFSKPIPSKNPEVTTDSGTSTCCLEEAKPKGLHIPSWLLDFPKESLYKTSEGGLVKGRKVKHTS
ncbi:unnamed protein product [Lathyrus sativus]|nr:unnamed protein product [Lathyrus sativus]